MSKHPSNHSNSSNPKFTKSITSGLLWDIDLQNFNPDEYLEFLAIRIATKGKLADIKWFITQYGLDKFTEIVAGSRTCPDHVSQFWKEFMLIQRK